jgi:hypothetical protein
MQSSSGRAAGQDESVGDDLAVERASELEEVIAGACANGELVLGFWATEQSMVCEHRHEYCRQLQGAGEFDP